MANILIQKLSRRTRRVTTRVYLGTLTGNYVTGGEPLDPTAATDPNSYNEPIAGIYDAGAIAAHVFESKVVRFPGGYMGEIVPGSAPTGWNNAFRLKLYSAPGTELAAAAYPAAILADNFEFEISGPNGTF